MTCIDDLRRRVPFLLALLCCACPADDSGDTGDGVSDGQTSMATTTGDGSAGSAAPTTAPPDTSDSDADSASDATDPTQEETEGDTTPPTTTEGDTDPGATFTVNGSIRQLDLQPWKGNDLAGPYFLAMFDACNADPPSPPIANGGGEADLSDGNTAPFEFTDVPNGTWYIVAFLDDNGNVDPKNPAPDQGDLVLADGFDPGCVEVVVDGADVTDVDVALNFVLPF